MFKKAGSIIHRKDNHPEKDAELTKEIYDIAKEWLAEGGRRLRGLSSQIHQNIQIIPCYRILEFFGIVRKRKVLYEVALKLMELGGADELSKTRECQDAIIKLLHVKHLIQAAREREKQIAKT